MNRSLFCWALLISFTGSLPIGTLNVAIANLIVHMDIGGAVGFGLGAILVEMLLVRIAVVVVRKLEGMKQLLAWFSAGACLVIFILAALVLKNAFQAQVAQGIQAAMEGSSQGMGKGMRAGSNADAVLPFAGQGFFVAGILLSLLNPLHLPFWMGWTAVLTSKKIMTHAARSYNIYVAAIGLGTALAFVLYGLTGHLLIPVIREQRNLLNWLLGITLLVTGLLTAYKMLGRGGVVRG